MADIDKVEQGLEHCTKGDGRACFFGCPYFQGTKSTKCFEELAKDALELVKIMKKEKPIAPIKGEQGKCPICGHRADHKYCPNCGQALDWNL